MFEHSDVTQLQRTIINDEILSLFSKYILIRDLHITVMNNGTVQVKLDCYNTITVNLNISVDQLEREVILARFVIVLRNNDTNTLVVRVPGTLEKYHYDEYTFINIDKTLRKMLETPDDITASDFDGCKYIHTFFSLNNPRRQRTIIMIAVRLGLVNPLKKMLENPRIKSLINSVNEAGENALIVDKVMHTFPNMIECVRVLLENGINVNIQDNSGHTALMYAAMWYKTPLVLEYERLLLNHDAEMTSFA